MFCSKCGHQLEIGSKFCGKCGAAQVVNTQPVNTSPAQVVNIPPVKTNSVGHKNYAKTFLIVSSISAIVVFLFMLAIFSILSSYASLFVVGTSSNEKKAIQLVEEKYGEDFDFIDFGFNGIGSENYITYFKTTDGKNIMFQAFVDKEGTFIEDSYSMNVVGYELTSALNKELSDLENDHFAFVYTGDITLEGDGKDTTYDTFSIDNGNWFYYIKIYLENGSMDSENLDKIYTALEDFYSKYPTIKCTINIFETKDDVVYNDVVKYYEEKIYIGFDSDFNSMLENSKIMEFDTADGYFEINDGLNLTREKFINSTLAVYDGWN